ncbi:MAG: hypothetical protein ABUK01_05010 [Leptospirales bacterium]
MNNIFKIFFALLLLFSCVFAVSNRYIRLDGFRYYFHGGRSKTTQQQLLLFHDIFKNQITNTYETFNVKIPNRFEIHIADNASVFSEVTGRAPFVASLYWAEHDSFYFQNVSSLRRQNILSSAISHEICHQALTKERTGPTSTEETIMSDEAFCLSYSPILKPKKNTAEVFHKFRTFKQFQESLTRNMLSGNRSKVYTAYHLAYAWGDYLIKRFGLAMAFQITAEHNLDNFEIIFAEFLRSL